MTDSTGYGWAEYRLLVTAMLERHDLAIESLEENKHILRGEVREAISVCESALRDLIDAKFVQLGQMHKSQVENAKSDLIKEVKKAAEESSQVKVAKITSRWEFWASVIGNAGAIIIALIALLK